MIERRDLLVSGWRRLVRVFPGLLAGAGGLTGVLAGQVGTAARPEASCFPKGFPGEAHKSQPSSTEEE